ncbi:hypothetical protein F4678DRAFT_168256 [Xylaria arbuscula]|nr:hypothetical protein F4678DRAFT_168256 [Xylaria arbuscula]
MDWFIDVIATANPLNATGHTNHNLIHTRNAKTLYTLNKHSRNKEQLRKRMPNPTRAELLDAARAFCESFAQKKPLEEILSHFSSSRSGAKGKDDGDDRSDGDDGGGILIHEHGFPQLAPFLGRDYRGPEGAREYFETLGRFLSYEDMRFVEFAVDASGGEKNRDVGGKVMARGKAKFTWAETGNSWDETFVYVLCFDAQVKVSRYEVWADSGAAYLASRGEL